MLPSFKDQLTVALAASGCNFKARGPLGTGIRFFVNSDPANVRHIFTSNHANYPKGEDFADILRGTLFTVDGEPCRQQRAMNHSILNNPRLLGIRARLCRDKVVNGLLPFLARMASSRTPFDMEELLTRLVFDLTATLTLGVDPGYLSISSTSSSMMHMPSMHVCTAIDTVMEVGLLRHAMPASVWKAMRQLNVGPERKLAVAHKQLHGFVREMVIARRKLASSLANNPRVVSAIRKELAPLISIRKDKEAASACSSFSSTSSSSSNNNNTMVIFEPEEIKGLVYLEAAIMETLRLYPPGPLERKAVMGDDVLPSGHPLCSGETILVSIYAMARMEALWGFGGPCAVAQLAQPPGTPLAQMKTIVAAVVWNFDVELLQGQSIKPKLSCTLQMNNKLMVTVNKTN
ncbi:hypothetical protein U9M48_037829 [Paspalum notatum var. saurae]|uniref:Cytochrome P450 n=1 Tax=Paspalum notatum var. saurae TaxID=547442 RepID=A0AAQ3UFW3_PASNO